MSGSRFWTGQRRASLTTFFRASAATGKFALLVSPLLRGGGKHAERRAGAGHRNGVSGGAGQQIIQFGAGLAAGWAS